MSHLIEEYRRSLKLPEAEELFDLGFYRPVAFAVVKGIYRLPVTPNQITMLSLVAGLVAAWLFASGLLPALAWGACAYAAANILDCADGQLARLQKSGTPLGRLVDGIADYVSSVAIFLGIGVGLSAAGSPAWIAVIGAGISSAAHAMLFDHYQSEFLSVVLSERNFTDNELEKISAELARSRSAGRGSPRTMVLSLYLRYLGLQKSADTGSARNLVDPELYRRANTGMIRLWSFLGPTTNRTLLIVCAVAGRLDFYLYGVMTGGNVWLVVCYLLQKRIHRSLDNLSASAAGGIR